MYYREIIYNEYTTENKLNKNLMIDEDEIEATKDQLLLNRINSMPIEFSQVYEDLLPR